MNIITTTEHFATARRMRMSFSSMELLVPTLMNVKSTMAAASITVPIVPVATVAHVIMDINCRMITMAVKM